MEKLRVAVIGCGIISARHLDSVFEMEGLDLVAVCDIKEDRASETAKKYNTKYYTDYKELLSNEKLDAIHICLPHYLHTVVAKEALMRGINVLTEKPMSIDYEDAVKIVEFAEEKGLTYGVIFQCRYDESAKLVKERILDGKLGKVLGARSVLTWHRTDEYYSQSGWRGTWEKEGGGVIINQKIHTIDLVNWFIDDTPESVLATLTTKLHKIEVEDSVDGLIRYKNGASYVFYATNNYILDEPIEIRLKCEHGKAVLTSEDATIIYNNGETEHVTNNTVNTNGKDYWGKNHYAQIAQFYKAVRKEEPLEISGREALKIQKIVSDIYKCR